MFEITTYPVTQKVSLYIVAIHCRIATGA